MCESVCEREGVREHTYYGRLELYTFAVYFFYGVLLLYRRFDAMIVLPSANMASHNSLIIDNGDGGHNFLLLETAFDDELDKIGVIYVVVVVVAEGGCGNKVE